MPMGFPFKYQDEMYTCGVACLQMLSECFQLRISSQDGTNPMNSRVSFLCWKENAHRRKSKMPE